MDTHFYQDEDDSQEHQHYYGQEQPDAEYDEDDENNQHFMQEGEDDYDHPHNRQAHMNYEGAYDEMDDDEVSQNSILDNDLVESHGMMMQQQQDDQSYIGGHSHVMHNNQSSMLDAEHLVMDLNQNDEEDEESQ